MPGRLISIHCNLNSNIEIHKFDYIGKKSVHQTNLNSNIEIHKSKLNYKL